MTPHPERQRIAGAATVSVFANAIYEYTIEAWGDIFRSWQHEFATKFRPGQTDLKSETLEGAQFIETCRAGSRSGGRGTTPSGCARWPKQIRERTPAEVNELAHTRELEALMTA